MSRLVPRCGLPTTTALLCVLVIGGGTVRPALAADPARTLPAEGFVYPHALMTLGGTEAPSVLPEQQRIADDLVEVADAQYASLDGLAAGSREAQDRQRRAIAELGLPLEVKTRRTGIVFRLIPAGSLRMGTIGSSFSESIYADDEGPHRVTLTQAFYCGKYEVTQGQWESVWVGSNPSYFKNAGRDAPVEGVSWGDCQRFVKKLCQKEEVPEGTYRLLTEAEWEYACRAGTQAALYNGDLVIKGAFNGPALDPIAWYGGNSEVQYAGGYDSSGWSEKQYNHKSAGTHPVGQKLANAYGLYDMIGNVEEWCQDRYGAYPAGSVTDPLGPPSGVDRVCRGGKWSSVPDFCRSAERERWKPSHYYNGLGLRLARTAPSYYSGGFLAE